MSSPLLLPLDDDQLLPGALHLFRLGHVVPVLRLGQVRLGRVVIEDPGAPSLGVRVVIGVSGVLLRGQIILENIITVGTPLLIVSTACMHQMTSLIINHNKQLTFSRGLNRILNSYLKTTFIVIILGVITVVVVLLLVIVWLGICRFKVDLWLPFPDSLPLPALVDVVTPRLGLLRLPLSDDDVLLLKLHAEAQDVAVNLHQPVSASVQL